MRGLLGKEAPRTPRGNQEGRVGQRIDRLGINCRTGSLTVVIDRYALIRIMAGN
jgi:hypothetical protein